MYSFYLANRIFFYRVLLRLTLRSTSSKNLISNINTIINKKFIEENLEKKINLHQKNKNLHINYYKNHYDEYNGSNNEYNSSSSSFGCFLKEEDNDKHASKKIKIDNQPSNNNDYYYTKDEYNKVDFNQLNKIKYWLCNISYMEMTKDEFNDFMTSCLYHQITFILKNLVSKCIDFLSNQCIFFSRIAKLKTVNMEKTDFYEFSSIYTLYQIGIVYLSKYVANHGVDFYQDSVITAYTNIEQLKNRLKDDTYRNNWYIGKQYTSDSHKIKISNIINSVNQPVNTYNTVKTRSENESLLIMDNKTNDNPNSSSYNNLNNNFKSAYNNYYFNINTNISTDTTNESIKQNIINVDYIKTNDGLINICDKILELIYNSEAETKYDINLNKEIYDFVDTYYDQNIKSKSYCCKDCYRHKHDYCNDKTKENFLELLKILKYFYNIDEYVPQNCDIYNCNNEINNYLYTDSSIPTYQYFYDELTNMKKYFKDASIYSDNFGYLINKANYSIRFGLDSFDNEVVFNNSYF